MNTSYSDIYKYFLINCPTNDLPQSDEGKYILIQSAIGIYNLKSSSYKSYVKSNIKADDIMEELNVELTSEELLIFCHCLKLAHLKGQYTSFTQVYGVFAKEMGFREYKGQVSAREHDISETDKFITEMLEQTVTDWEV